MVKKAEVAIRGAATTSGYLILSYRLQSLDVPKEALSPQVPSDSFVVQDYLGTYVHVD